tara:strand:+ start:6796 stop:9144 length:2349 start_codon:yes stop_codon:yes gene_type:complete
MTEITPFEGTEDEAREKASKPILSALKRSADAFKEWDASCHLIDDTYSRHGSSYENLMATYGAGNWQDAEMDLFWSSSEVLKPAVYAKPPVPAIAPIFNDTGALKATTAEVLERSAVSTFKATGIDDVMTGVRDDLIFSGRGVMWMRYETGEGKGKRVCLEHKDRDDFLHDVARKWCDVGWVAGASWMSRDEIKARFKTLTDDQLDGIQYLERRDETDQREKAMSAKAKVWEVWHRANNRVYWVVEGLDVYLEDAAPHLELDGFFPCPRPAYATLRRRSLIPVPDFERYAGMFAQINRLTGRIYLLLDQVKMKGLVPSGGDVADAIQQLMRAEDDSLLIAVPGAALMEGGSAVVWLPLDQIAAAITGLIEARRQLIEDFYQLSGISDIMRGATEAEETLGAQRLKSQFGSVRVRQKIDEMQRIAADAVKIASEIIAEKFDGKTLLAMSQMDLPTTADIKARIKEIEEGAEAEFQALSDQAEQAQAQVEDPQQAQQMFQQAQQEIMQKYGAMLEEAESLVPIDDVVDLLRDDRARSFAFEIETDSTILTDEMAEKQSRSEFVTAFNGATQGLMALAAAGEAGAKLAGEMLKFSLAPYRAGRQMTAAIDEFVKQAPQMAAQMQGESGQEGVAELAEAEMEKARAQMAKVESDAAAKQVENERKMFELQQKGAQQEREFQAKMAKVEQDAQALNVKTQEALAKVDNLRADTMKKLAEAGIAVDNAALDEFVSLREIDLKERQQAQSEVNAVADRARTQQRDVIEDSFRERGEARADMQQPQEGEE